MLARLVARAAAVVLTGAVGGGGALMAYRVVGGRSDAGTVAVKTPQVLADAATGAGADGEPDEADLAHSSAATASLSPSPSGSAADSAGVNSADRVAGVLQSTVPPSGSGHLAVVPGSAPAPGSGPVKRVRVEVETGLAGVDPHAFAAFVLATLNDPHGWGHGGRMTFARTSGEYDLRVVLASPDTSERLCGPLQTEGTLSCGIDDSAVLTLYRWVKATPDYGTDRTGYRRYLVNHEVGHTLGHGHELCPGAGRVAPVMMQQTKGLKGCRSNSWPYP